MLIIFILFQKENIFTMNLDHSFNSSIDVTGFGSLHTKVYEL